MPKQPPTPPAPSVEEIGRALDVLDAWILHEEEKSPPPTNPAVPKGGK